MGGWLRLGLYPNRQVAWWTTWIVWPDRPASARPTTGPRSRPATAWSQWRLSAPTTPPTSGSKSNSCAHSNRSAWRPARPPASSTRQRPSTRRASRAGPAARLDLDLTWTTDGVPYHYDLTTRYEIPCLVTGTVAIGGETFTVDGQGQRDHSWGVRDWWAFGWCWCSVRLEDGTRVHLADIRMGIPDMPVFFGYIQKPAESGGPGEFHPATALTVTEDLGQHGFPSKGRIDITAGDSLGLDVTPVAFGPVLCATTRTAGSAGSHGR